MILDRPDLASQPGHRRVGKDDVHPLFRGAPAESGLLSGLQLQQASRAVGGKAGQLDQESLYDANLTVTSFPGREPWGTSMTHPFPGWTDSGITQCPATNSFAGSQDRAATTLEP